MNNLTLRQLECFLEVCRDFNFSRAAGRLNLAQPPLSRHIKELESSVGCQLFERSSRSVRLTAAGHAFLEQVYTIPQLLNQGVDAARRARTGETSRFRIGFVGAILNDQLIEIFRNFRSIYSTIRLDLTESSPLDLINRLKASELEGVFLGVEIQSLPPEFRQVKWHSEALRLCMPTAHPLSQKSTIAIEDLQDQSFITLARASAPAYRELLQNLFQTHKVRCNIVQEVGSTTAVLAMVVAGAGLALLPGSAITSTMDYVETRSLQEKEATLHEVFIYRKSDQKLLAPLLSIISPQ